MEMKFQFTHPVWGATIAKRTIFVPPTVSIHAPRVGCDQMDATLQAVNYVSIHAPRVGCDFDADPDSQAVREFQFTHPVWGATLPRSRLYKALTCRFNSRTPCGVRHSLLK